jgi:hypothetical protein
LSAIEIARAALEGRLALLRATKITLPTLRPWFPRILAGPPRPWLFFTGLEAGHRRPHAVRSLRSTSRSSLRAKLGTTLGKALSTFTTEPAMMSPSLTAVLAEAFSPILSKAVMVTAVSEAVTAAMRESLSTFITEPAMMTPSRPAVPAEALPVILSKPVMVMAVSEAVTAMMREPLSAKFAESMMVTPSRSAVLRETLSASLAETVLVMAAPTLLGILRYA